MWRELLRYKHKVLQNGYLQIFLPQELEMVKYVYVVIKIMNDVLWRGREGVFALTFYIFY